MPPATGVLSRSSARASRTSRRGVGWSATSSRPTSTSAARTPSSATSGGSSTRSSRWSSTSSSCRSSCRNGPPDYPLFIFAAILPWKWFSASIIDATTSIVRHDQLIKQIQFPKLVLPVAATTAGVVSFAFGTVALALLMLFYSDRISPYLLLIPVIAAVQFVFTLACAFLVAAGNVFFRDLGNVVSACASAVVVPVARPVQPGERSRAVGVFQQYPVLITIASANPFAILFEAYRMVIYGTPDQPARPARTSTSLAVLLVASIGFLALTTIIFKRLEPNFAKVV